MKAKILFSVLAIFAVALISEVAMAGPGFGLPYISNLTPDQITKIQSIREKYLKDITPLQQQLLAKKLELRSLWFSQNPDQAKISTLQKEILNLNAKVQEKATNASLEMRKVLTPEQQAQLTTYGYGLGYGKGKMARMGRW